MNALSIITYSIFSGVRNIMIKLHLMRPLRVEHIISNDPQGLYQATDEYLEQVREIQRRQELSRNATEIVQGTLTAEERKTFDSEAMRRRDAAMIRLIRNGVQEEMRLELLDKALVNRESERVEMINYEVNE